MQKKLYSLLLVVGLMLVLPLSIAAVSSTNLDIDSQYISCDMPLTNSPSGVNGDMIAIATSDGDGCELLNVTDNTYDVAVQYRTGIEYGTVEVERYRWWSLTLSHYSNWQYNQNDLLRRLVTTGFTDLGPGDMMIVSNDDEGKVNIEGFVVRKR